MSDTIELPTDAEIEQQMIELEQRGVTKDATYVQCGDETEIRVHPDKSTMGAICRTCMLERIRTTD